MGGGGIIWIIKRFCFCLYRLYAALAFSKNSNTHLSRYLSHMESSGKGWWWREETGCRLCCFSSLFPLPSSLWSFNISPSLLSALSYFHSSCSTCATSSLTYCAFGVWQPKIVSFCFSHFSFSSPPPFHLPLSLSQPHPGTPTSLNSWGVSVGALVTAVDLIKTPPNDSGNIKVRKYNKSPRRYWIETPYFIYEYNSYVTDIWATELKPTGNDVNQLDNFM